MGGKVWTVGLEIGVRLKNTPRFAIPNGCIAERCLELFIARATLRELIVGLGTRAKDGAAR